MYIYSLVKKYSISKTLFIAYFTFIALIAYFIVKLFFGQKGFVEMLKLQEQIQNKDLTKKELINEIKNKKIRVDGMRSESLDLDLLDEQSRQKLNYSGKDEIILYKNNVEEPKK
jgi:cell division protein FtsB